MKKTNKVWLVCGLWLVIVLGAGPVQAMKALSDDDLGGVSGTAGLTIFAQDLDATLLQMDDFKIDLSPDAGTDWQFLIVDDSKSSVLRPGNDDNSIAAALCGSPTDESVPIDVDTLGFELDVGSGDLSSDGRMNNDAVTFAMTGYGSTNMHYVWEMVQFYDPSTGDTQDVFGFHLGEIFWIEEYDDPEPTHFMQLFLSPPSQYADAAFFDSWMSDWGGLGAADIRSNEGIAGELRLKLGGGELNFKGYDKESKGSSIMFAGDILDDPYTSNGNTVFPNWKTLDKDPDHYYSHSVSDWQVIGDFAAGVHHERTHDTSGYPYPDYAASQIGQSSPTRPIRFEVATADGYDVDNNGNPDTYLVTYVHGHYSRTVYYPDSGESGMGTSSGAVSSQPTKRDYILGEVRIGQTGEATADKDGDGIDDSVDHVGAWALNDLSMTYTKMVIPGQRNLEQEISTDSEPFLIPNEDYRGNQMSFVGNPTSTERDMSVAGTLDGYADAWNDENRYEKDHYSRGYHRKDITIPSSGWD